MLVTDGAAGYGYILRTCLGRLRSLGMKDGLSGYEMQERVVAGSPIGRAWRAVANRLRVAMEARRWDHSHEVVCTDRPQQAACARPQEESLLRSAITAVGLVSSWIPPTTKN